MNPQERLEAFEAVLDALREENRTAPIVVEGDRDEAALRRLGLEGTVVRLNQGIPVFAVAEALAARHAQVVVLTDWDRKGGQLARLLVEGLEANGAHVLLQYRRELARLAHVRTVEGLAGWFETLRESAARNGPPR